MSKEKQIKSIIHAKDTEITVLSMTGEEDYISLTDIARYVSDEPKDVVKNWLRNRETISFLGLWEQLNNPNFKGVEFDSFKMQAGSNAFTLSPQNGFGKPMQSASVPNRASMAVHSLKRILHLNLLLGYLLSSNCILFKTISV